MLPTSLTTPALLMFSPAPICTPPTLVVVAMGKEYETSCQTVPFHLYSRPFTDAVWFVVGLLGKLRAMIKHPIGF